MKLDREQDLNVLYQDCVFLRLLQNQDGCSGHCLAETLSTSLHPQNGIQRILPGAKISTSSAKFVILVPIEKPRWPSWPLIG